MNYLLDTHTFLWFINDDPTLSVEARILIEDPSNIIYLSISSVWEMAIKVSLGKLVMPLPFAEFITEQLDQNQMMLYPVNVEHNGLVVILPFHHRDPFDRMIIAQSLADQIPVIGRDATFDMELTAGGKITALKKCC